MAKGRIYNKKLKEDFEKKKTDLKNRMQLLDIFLASDDEGYITLEDAKYFAKLKQRDLDILEAQEFIKKKGNLIKNLRWNRYEKIPPSRFEESSLKEDWPNKLERHDGIPLSYKEFLVRQIKRIEEIEKENRSPNKNK